jgi:anthranilate phosphoribosyltransferase
MLSDALRLLGSRRTLVVCGEDGLDEVTLSGVTSVTESRDGRQNELRWTPANFGLPGAGRETILVSGPEESAKVIRNVLDAKRGAPRDIVVLNAAAALWIAGDELSPIACAERAAEAIDSGAARDLLARLVELSAAGEE